MGALLALVPFRDWLYAAIIAAVGLFAWHTYHKYEVAVTYAADAKAETAQVQAKAAADAKAKDDDYAAKLKATLESQDAEVKAAAATSADLANRLRQYQAHRCPVAVLPGAAPATPAGTPSPGSVDEAVSGVIAAAAHDNAVITAERAERDALTGK